MSKNFEWAMRYNKIVLVIMGIWPIGNDSKLLSNFLRVPFMISVMYFGLFLPQLYALTLVINDFQLVIDNLLTACPALTSCIKLFFIWKNTKVLKPVIESIARDWKRNKTNLEEDIMKKAAFRGRLITLNDYLIMSICHFGFIIIPTLGYDLRIINNITDASGTNLIVQSAFPWDYAKSPILELTYFVQLLGSFFAGLAICVPDDYFCTLLYHTSAQFQILGNEIQDIIKNSDNSKLVDRKFRNFIDRHVELIKIVSAVEKVWCFVIMSQLFCMVGMISCLGFHILNMLDETTSYELTPLQVATLGGTLITMMIHTFVDCFASESLATNSADIFFKIYCSDWYTLTSKKKKILIPMMLMSKKSRPIKAGYILPINLVTFCSIMKSTAGYVSVLIAASGKSRE